MNKKLKITIAFITMLIFSMSISSNALLKVVGVTDFSYSDYLVTDTEIAWQLTKYVLSPVDLNTSDVFEIADGKIMEQGDVFKVKILKDLNDLSLDYMSDLFFTNESWGEFFLNDVSLGTNSSLIFWSGPGSSSATLFTSFILPTTIQTSAGSQNYFDAVAEEFAALPDTETGGIKITNTADTYKMKLEMHQTLFLFGTFKIDSKLEIVYNKQWGLLVKYSLSEKITTDEETKEVEFLFESVNEEIQVPYNWTFGFIAIFVAGVIILRRKKKH